LAAISAWRNTPNYAISGAALLVKAFYLKTKKTLQNRVIA
jgi:hypothetical protein